METSHHVTHAHTLALQGVWTNWENMTPFDLSWKNLIYGPGPRLLSFVLNASINSLPTPDMLKLLNYRQTAECKLCNVSQCTLVHILANCSVALRQKRYTWRHDSVLLVIQKALTPQIEKMNSKKSTLGQAICGQRFVKAGSLPTLTKIKLEDGLLSHACDWEMLVDFDQHKIVFPPVICPTSQRPDVVIWSTSSKTVILIELTCPAEENLQTAAITKTTKYCELMNLAQDHGWRSHLFTVEAGTRGMISQNTLRCFRTLGLSNCVSKQICKQMSEVVARCSFSIWLSRNNVVWQNFSLVEPKQIPRSLST